MPRRIELELTSERPDGSWTWRAAGAREPRGELDGSLLPGGTKVGDVLRADADFNVDGITVLSVLPPKGTRIEPERLEVIGPQREFTPVTSTLVGKSERGGDRRGPRGDRPDRPDRPDRGPRPRRDDRPDRGPRAEGPRPERPRRERPAPPPPKPKPKKLRAGRAHRDALVAGLSPEQQPIAEQLFRGGMPSVRTALEEQNAKAKAEGLPEMPSATVLGIAEDLVGRVRVADWLDRAEAAVADAEEIALRDLRAVVTSADDVARDESTREFASRLREVLDRRTAAEQDEWLRDLTSSLEGGRVVRALRLSSRPPQPGEAVPAELTTKLAEAASEAMTADIAPDRWGTLLDAVAYSPVRRNVVPAGAPAEPGDELLAMARKHAGRVPSAAKLFGIEPPPPPASKRAPRAPKPKPAPQKVSRPPLPPLPGGARRIPPPPRPTAPTAPAGEVPASATADSPEPHGDVLAADAPGIDSTPTSVVETSDAAVVDHGAEHPDPHGDVLAADAPLGHVESEAVPTEPPAVVEAATAPEAEPTPSPLEDVAAAAEAPAEAEAPAPDDGPAPRAEAAGEAPLAVEPVEGQLP
jgi:hypothetical protein